MKFARYLLPAFLLIFFAAPLLLPRQLIIAQTGILPDSRKQTFSYLVNLESWIPWSLWMLGPNQSDVRFSGIPGVVGSEVKGDGPADLKGYIRLIEISEPEELILTTLAGGFWPTELQVHVQLKELSETQTEARFTLSSPLRYPLEPYLYLIKKNELRGLLEQSLLQLGESLKQERQRRLRETTAFTGSDQ